MHRETEQYIAEPPPRTTDSFFEILRVSLQLGCTSFGGPSAHLGYFYHEYVQRRKWLDEKSYADLVALAQFLPGPASSQVGIGIGVMRGGLWGGILAWLGFTLPSALALFIFALLVQGGDISHIGWLHGLKVVAVAIVVHALIGMGRQLAPDRSRASMAILAAIGVLWWPSTYTQVLVIGLAALGGLLFFKKVEQATSMRGFIPLRKRVGIICLLAFLLLFLGLPLVRQLTSLEWIAIIDSFYRTGSLVFGGGHVVLPLLERELVPVGLVSAESFLAGYGATQAVPGPLFTFAAYLGTVINGWWGASLATIAIFLPGFLLIVGMLPFWNGLRQFLQVQRALMGVNAAVVGILLAALYDPLWTSTIQDSKDFALAAFLFALLSYWKLPPWLVVIAGAVGGMVITNI